MAITRRLPTKKQIAFQAALTAKRQAAQAVKDIAEQKKKARAVKRSWKRPEDCKKAIADINLERGCADCGYRKCPAALQFDHVRSTKSFTIGSGTGRPWEETLLEIAKCDVRCANCHIERHIAEGRPKSTRIARHYCNRCHHVLHLPGSCSECEAKGYYCHGRKSKSQAVRGAR